MIFLTGDVHHASLHTKEFPYLFPATEVDLARRYVEITQEHGLKTTLFVTGRACLEEGAKLEAIAKFPHVEIGGHTFECFSPLWLHRIYKLACRSYWRSYAHQYRDVARTMRQAASSTGREIVSWRNHCYDYDRNTVNILHELGIKVWSDELRPSACRPYRTASGCISLPLNIIQDHNMLYHGYRTPEWYARARTRFIHAVKRHVVRRNVMLNASRAYHADEWFELFKRGVDEKIGNDGVAVMNLHPACMYLLDDFATFRKICAHLACHPSEFVSDAEKYL